MRKNPELDKLAKEILDDGEQESWENGKLGRDVKHMKVVNEEETKKFIDSKETFATSIRLPKKLVKNLKNLAEKKWTKLPNLFENDTYTTCK